MSLLDYQEAVPWANAIKLSVLEGRMPPFLPGDDGGPFQGARALTAQEIDTIVDWTVGTTPEGVLNPSAARAKRVAEREPWGWGPTALMGVI